MYKKSAIAQSWTAWFRTLILHEFYSQEKRLKIKIFGTYNKFICVSLHKPSIKLVDKLSHFLYLYQSKSHKDVDGPLCLNSTMPQSSILLEIQYMQHWSCNRPAAFQKRRSMCKRRRRSRRRKARRNKSRGRHRSSQIRRRSIAVNSTSQGSQGREVAGYVKLTMTHQMIAWVCGEYAYRKTCRKKIRCHLLQCAKVLKALFKITVAIFRAAISVIKLLGSLQTPSRILYAIIQELQRLSLINITILFNVDI